MTHAVDQIAITNTYGDENRGSAALNIAAVRLLRNTYPTATIGLVTINEFDAQDRVRRYRHTLASCPEVQILPPLLDKRTLRFGALTSMPSELAIGRLPSPLVSRETKRFLEAADLVVSRGGVIYRESSTIARTAGLLRRTSAIRFAQSRGIPTAFLGLHAAAMGGRLATRITSRQFDDAALLLPRGPLSNTAVRAISHNPNCKVLPDSVFGAELRRANPEAVERRSLVLSVSDPARPYFHSIAKVVGGLMNEGHADHVQVVVQVDGADSDLQACIDLQTALPMKSELISDDLTPVELIDLYSAAVAVITTRLHVSIFGLLGGTPSFPIDLSPDTKAIDVLSAIGLDGLVLERGNEQSWTEMVSTGIERGRGPIERSVDSACNAYKEFPNILRNALDTSNDSRV